MGIVPAIDLILHQHSFGKAGQSLVGRRSVNDDSFFCFLRVFESLFRAFSEINSHFCSENRIFRVCPRTPAKWLQLMHEADVMIASGTSAIGYVNNKGVVQLDQGGLSGSRCSTIDHPLVLQLDPLAQARTLCSPARAQEGMGGAIRLHGQTGSPLPSQPACHRSPRLAIAHFIRVSSSNGIMISLAEMPCKRNHPYIPSSRFQTHLPSVEVVVAWLPSPIYIYTAQKSFRRFGRLICLWRNSRLAYT
jgi:hypothetical protein